MKNNKHVAAFLVVAMAGMGLVHFTVPGGWGEMFAPARSTARSGLGSTETLVVVPLWLLCVLWTVILTAVGAALLIAIHRRRSVVMESPVVTKAEIFGLRWRWSYDGGVISQLTSHCPKCDQPVSPGSETRHGFLHLISYQCACGKWRSKSFQCSQAQMLDRVSHAIAEKIASSPATGRRSRVAK